MDKPLQGIGPLEIVVSSRVFNPAPILNAGEMQAIVAAYQK
jgi:hypothetical protein